MSFWCNYPVVLSWDAMIETLVEYDYDLKNNDHISSHDHVSDNLFLYEMISFLIWLFQINSGINANENLSTADPEMAYLRVSRVRTTVPWADWPRSLRFPSFY